MSSSTSRISGESYSCGPVTTSPQCSTAHARSMLHLEHLVAVTILFLPHLGHATRLLLIWLSPPSVTTSHPHSLLYAFHRKILINLCQDTSIWSVPILLHETSKDAG